MPKIKFEKTIRIPPKPPRKQGITASFVMGDKLSKTPKPKSLTPPAKYQAKKK